VAVLFVGVDAGDLLDVDNIGAVGADEAGGVEDFFEVAHRAVLEEGAVVGVDLDIVVGGFEVVDVFDGDDLDLSSGFDDDALLLGGGFGGGVEEGLLRGGSGGFRCAGWWVGGKLIEPFAEGFVEAFFGEGFEEVVDGVGLEGADSVFVEGGGEDDGGRVFDEFEHFEAVDLWHLDIEEDEVGVEAVDLFYPFGGVCGFGDDLDLGEVEQ